MHGAVTAAELALTEAETLLGHRLIEDGLQIVG